MNANRIINMVVRMVLRKVMKSGMNAVGNRMNKDKGPAQSNQMPNAQEATKRTKQALRVSRRMGRF